MIGFHSATAPIRSGFSNIINNLGLALVALLFGTEVLFLGAAVDALVEHYAHLAGNALVLLHFMTGLAIIGAVIMAVRMMLQPTASIHVSV